MHLRTAALALLLPGCASPGQSTALATGGGAIETIRAMPLLSSRVPRVRAPGARVEVSLPARGDAPLRLQANDAWLEIAPLDRAPGRPQTSPRMVEHREVAPSTDVVFVADGDRAEELRVLRDARASTASRAHLRASPGLHLRLVDATVNVVDASGRVRFVSDRPFVVDARGVRRDARLALEGTVLTVDFDRDGLAYPIVVDPTWSTVASMTVPRGHHTLTTLSTGKLLAAGGTGLSSAELYDPAANTWSAAGAMSGARADHTATLLSSGKVLVAGGATAATAQLYDATSGFGANLALTAARVAHTATLLPSGKVLLVGGVGQSTAELFDPATSTSAAVSSMSAARSRHTATLVAGGKVLVVGGTSLATAPAAELYDPASNTWSPAVAGAPAKRSWHGAAALPGGKALVFGGSSPESTVLSTAELFDPATATWSAGPSLPVPRAEAPTIPFGAGSVLYVGGFVGASYSLATTAELYDPVADKWSTTPALAGDHPNAAGAVLPDGRLIISGGEWVSPFGGEETNARVEIFDPGLPGRACKSDGECASGACADGVCCDRACSGQCESCALPGKVGTCNFVTGAPPAGRPACSGAAKCTGTTFTPAEACDGTGKCAAAPRDCGAYACTADGCRESCTSGDQCAQNHVCTGGRCVAAAAAVCADDNRTSMAGDGTRVECGAYLCDPSAGRCRDECSASTECAPGFACDGVRCAAKAAEPAADDDGGCATRAPHGEGSSAAVIALVAFGAMALGRRSRRR